MNITLKQANELAQQYNKNLRADDPRFARYVTIKGQHDFTALHYSNAFVMVDDAWVYLFTEHYGCQVFDKDDIYYRQYKPILADFWDEIKIAEGS